MRIVLASGSPRRVELLRTVYGDFDIEKSDVDETTELKDGVSVAKELALRKARAVARHRPHDLVIGADTSVWLGSTQYGKPTDRADAIRILTELNGKTHSVITGVAVVCGERWLADACVSQVKMTWTAREIEDYVDRFAPYDKAGAYGLQEFGDAHATYSGEYDNIVGLPVAMTKRLVESMEEIV